MAPVVQKITAPAIKAPPASAPANGKFGMLLLLDPKFGCETSGTGVVRALNLGSRGHGFKSHWRHNSAHDYDTSLHSFFSGERLCTNID